jgi:predicted nuclease of restriction endonuclease-like (RecB) superfamily
VEYHRLLNGIGVVSRSTQAAVTLAINQTLTLRNWLIGAYIIEHEQSGDPRAQYGDVLIRRLAQDLADQGCTGLGRTNLVNFRKFALTYPILAHPETLARVLHLLDTDLLPIGQTVSDFSATATAAPPIATDKIGTETPSLHFPALATRITETTSLVWQDEQYYLKLFRVLAWSNLLEFCRVEDPLKRAFYELECLKGKWSNRELRRQINSLLYERVGLSKDPAAVLALAKTGELLDSPQYLLRDPYVLEFLQLPEQTAYSELDLEQALIDHLQAFLHELGDDFCFMKRQFRITIANRHYFLDLLFYHRRLRCLVAIDLKLGSFEAAYAGQMNLYLNYLKEEVAFPDENPPVGIILCSEKDAEEVHYATAGMDSNLFVSRYLVALPSEAQLKRWLREEQERLKS